MPERQQVVQLPSVNRVDCEAIMAYMCFDLDYAASLEKLRQAAAQSLGLRARQDKRLQMLSGSHGSVLCRCYRRLDSNTLHGMLHPSTPIISKSGPIPVRLRAFR